MPRRLTVSSNAPPLTWLEVARRSRGMTQRELATKSTISQVQISRFENGHRTNPRRSTAKLLADALKVDVEDIFPTDGRTEPLRLLVRYSQHKKGEQ